MAEFSPEVKKFVEDKLEGMLLEAEKLCGPRNRFYQTPQIMFANIQQPRAEIFDDGRITIKLRTSVGHDADEASTECAHELIHCISPARQGAIVNCINDGTSTVLEEGLATYFQRHIHDEWLKVPRKMVGLRHYEKAAGIVKELLDIHPDAIIKLRGEQDCPLRLIDQKLIEKVLPDLPNLLAKKLGMCLSTLKMQLDLLGACQGELWDQNRQ